MAGVSLALDLSTNLARDLSDPGFAALDILLAAPSADAFFYGDYGYTLNGNKTAAVLSRLPRNGTSTYDTIEQSSAALQPPWGGLSPTGRRSLGVFDAVSLQALVDPLTFLGTAYSGVQAYSSLTVVSYAALNGRVAHSFGSVASSTHLIANRHVGTTGVDRRTRTGTGGTTTSDGTGAAHVAGRGAIVTEVYTGAAYSSWINGTLAINAAANTRNCTVDQFMVGCLRASGSYSAHMSGTVWGVILSRAQWTTNERQALEAAARAYWGF